MLTLRSGLALPDALSVRRGLTIPPDSGPAPYVGPLDIQSGAVVAYSQRAMAAAWVSNAITIRRDSDDTTMTFMTATNNAVDPAAVTAFLNGANGFIDTWFDQSGHTKNQMQATAANQPEWASSGIGSLPSVTFDRSIVQYLVATGVSLANGTYTIFVVAKVDVAATGQGYNALGINYDNFAPGGIFGVSLTSRTASANINVDASDDGDNTNEANGITTTAPADYTAAFLIDAAWQVSSVSIYYNGASQAADNLGFGTVGTFSGDLAIGAGDANPSATFVFNGQVAEVLIYDSILDDPTRLAIRQNIANYYGITLL